MKSLLLPLVLLLLGLGGGVGAALVLSPATVEETALPNPCGEPAAASDSAAAEAVAEEDHDDSSHTYVRLNNQFVVPLLVDGEVDAMAMLSLSVEIPAGQEEAIHEREPKLRDIFLQVLFDHANTGGFDGLFTGQSAMRELRGSLLDAAQEEMGGLVKNVLITDVVRQDQ
jgi:hypothetical protein